MSGEYAVIREEDRLRPSEAIIAAVRARYPTEAEIDAVLSRKMQRRHGPGSVSYTHLTLPTKRIV